MTVVVFGSANVDLVVTVGGVSAGAREVVRDALGRLPLVVTEDRNRRRGGAGAPGRRDDAVEVELAVVGEIHAAPSTSLLSVASASPPR